MKVHGLALIDIYLNLEYSASILCHIVEAISFVSPLCFRRRKTIKKEQFIKHLLCLFKTPKRSKPENQIIRVQVARIGVNREGACMKNNPSEILFKWIAFCIAWKSDELFFHTNWCKLNWILAVIRVKMEPAAMKWCSPLIEFRATNIVSLRNTTLF